MLKANEKKTKKAQFALATNIYILYINAFLYSRCHIPLVVIANAATKYISCFAFCIAARWQFFQMILACLPEKTDGLNCLLSRLFNLSITRINALLCRILVAQ